MKTRLWRSRCSSARKRSGRIDRRRTIVAENIVERSITSARPASRLPAPPGLTGCTVTPSVPYDDIPKLPPRSQHARVAAVLFARKAFAQLRLIRFNPSAPVVRPCASSTAAFRSELFSAAANRTASRRPHRSFLLVCQFRPNGIFVWYLRVGGFGEAQPVHHFMSRPLGRRLRSISSRS